MKEQKRFRVAFLFILLLVGGCNSGGQPAPATGSVVPSPLRAPGTAGTIAAVLRTSLIYPTRVEVTTAPTITATGTPAPTNTPTSLPPTWTSKPTLQPEEAQALVEELLVTNSGCRLPCWWGITPGETTWEEARTFLEQFVTQILTLSKDVYGVSYNNLPESVSRGAVGATISVQEGVIQEIRTGVNLPLEEVLQIYGQPDEVMIYVDAQSIDPQAPFTISLFYANLGFLANFIGKTNKGEILQICPSAISGD